MIAFDGILFDTLGFRADAIVNALAAEQITIDRQQVLSMLPAHSLAEAIRIIATDAHADETTLDLATLRAERAISELGSRGALLNVGVRDRLRRAAAVTRIVVRADSRRRDVEELLRLAELDSAISFVRCSDDVGEPAESAPHTQAGSLNAAQHANRQSAHTFAPRASVERSYAQITRRLYSNRTLLGTSANIGIALEFGEAGRTEARQHGFATPDSFDATNLAGA